MRTMLAILSATLLAVSTPGCNAEHDDDNTAALSQTEIDERLAAAISELEAQGFSGFAAAAQNGEMIAFAEAGAADPASGRVYTPDTQFDIGSLVKPITGLAASQLIAEGRLDPEARLGSFFDNVPADKAGITIAQMLTHTAGLGPAHGFDLNAMSREEMLEAAFAAELIGVPGEQYAYSNTGPSLVAAIIEDITGKGFETHIREDVLAPLGISDTGYWSVFDPERGDASAELGTVPEASWGGNNPVSWALIGNGGMVSTANDLLALGQAIVSDAINGEARAIWLEPRVDEGGGTMYGFGIGYADEPGLGPVHWHNGGNPAFQTEWWTILDSGITIVIHRNGGEPSLASALGPVLEAVTGAELGFADGPPDVEMVAGSDLPDTPEGMLATAFLDAIRSDEAAWQTFVSDRMGSEMRDQFPAEEHVAMFGTLSRDFGLHELSAYGMSDRGVHLELSRDGMPPMQLLLATVEEDGEPKLAGIAAM